MTTCRKKRVMCVVLIITLYKIRTLSTVSNDGGEVT